jgi:secreted PhoX family phosphatase
MRLSRRDLLRLGAWSGAGLGLGAAWWTIAAGPDDLTSYGVLGPPDVEGIRVPPGFSARVIARTGVPVLAGGMPWHAAPDAAACFALPDGGWAYVSNSEVDGGQGGVSAIRFDATGAVVDAYPLLRGSSRNCGGGATSWGTWLSGEEIATGRMYECDPARRGNGLVRPALGTFFHESAAEDPATGSIYLSEDHPQGRLYRFLPDARGRLSAGRLQAAVVTDGRVAWLDTAADAPDRRPETTPFNGGEGIIVDGPTMFLTTKGDDRIWRFDLPTSTVSVYYDGRSTPGLLTGVDQVVVHPHTRDLFVAEDGGDMQLVRVAVGAGTAHGELTPMLQFVGHDRSEITGPAFSPDGTRLYVSSQRGSDGSTGVTLEVTGPFQRWPGTATVSGRWAATRGVARVEPGRS